MLSKRIFVLVSLLLISFLMVGCGGVIPTTSNQAPDITSTAIETATVGAKYIYDVEATDPNLDTLTYSLTTKPGGMTINSATGLIQWTPTEAQKGNNDVTVVVSDGIESPIQEFVITVSARDPLAITVDSPLTFTVGGPYWFTVNMVANSDEGKSVVVSFRWPTSGSQEIEGTLEIDGGSDLKFVLMGDVFQTGVFTMADAEVNFRGTFDKAGTYGTTIKVKTYPGDVLLGSKYIEIVVTYRVRNKTTDEYYDTIQAAIDDASNSDTIEVSAGTYNEDVTINKALTLQGAGWGATTIQGQAGGDGALIISSSDVAVDGFTIKGAPQGKKTVTINVATSNVTFTNNKVVTAVNTGMANAWAGFETHCVEQSNLVIDGNIFEANYTAQLVYINPNATNIQFTNNTLQGIMYPNGLVVGLEGLDGYQNISGNTFDITSTYALLEVFGTYGIGDLLSNNFWPQGGGIDGNKIVNP